LEGAELLPAVVRKVGQKTAIRPESWTDNRVFARICPESWTNGDWCLGRDLGDIYFLFQLVSVTYRILFGIFWITGTAFAFTDTNFAGARNAGENLMTELSVRVEHREEASLIHLTGYLSGRSIESLQQALAQVREAERVRFIFPDEIATSCVGLRMLRKCVRPLREQGKAFCAVSPSPCLRKVFDFTGLSEEIEVMAV
jgi:anti-anti-sigma factor